MSVYSKKEDYYKDLSEVYYQMYEDQTVVSKAMMIIQGCIVEMHSDLIEYQKKHGSEKAAKARERLKHLTDNLQKISSLQTENYNLKIHNRNLTVYARQLKTELDELKISNERASLL